MEYEGWKDLVTVQTPGAGNSALYVIDSRAFQRIRTLRATFTTSATVANRQPFVQIQNGDGTIMCTFPSGVTLAASANQVISWIDGYAVANGSASPEGAVPFASLLLPPGYRYAIGLAGIQAADAITAISAWVEFLPTGEIGFPRGARPYEPAPKPV